MLPLNWIYLHTEAQPSVQRRVVYVADRVVLTSVSAAHRVAFPSSAAPLITRNHQVIFR